MNNKSFIRLVVALEMGLVGTIALLVLPIIM